ncbi:MAG: sugar phosphate isomerase/epimerase [Oscillospiraceae bacterium]|nr:sugar phosphate isomerase/epimerase [Oscillospiraceae bacterium]
MAIHFGVSLYCFQEEFLLGRMSLEDGVAAVANKVGCPGVEIIMDQTPLPGYRENGSVVNAEIAARWKDLMAKYGTVPTIYGGGLPISMYANRHQTVRERIIWNRREMDNCAALGFRVFRTCIIPHDDIDALAECFSYAEDLGITLDVEIHAPRGIHTWWTQDYIEALARKNSKAGGFVLDFGIFTKGLSLSKIHLMTRQGAKESVLLEIDKAHKAGAGLTDAEIEKLGGGTIELNAANMLRHATYENPEFIREIIPYIHAVHGKFYEMNEEGEEPAIEYAAPLKVLREEGWNGFIDSEYEGQRDYFDIGCDITMDCVEQVKRHQDMMRRILAE